MNKSFDEEGIPLDFFILLLALIFIGIGISRTPQENKIIKVIDASKNLFLAGAVYISFLTALNQGNSDAFRVFLFFELTLGQLKNGFFLLLTLYVICLIIHSFLNEKA